MLSFLNTNGKWSWTKNMFLKNKETLRFGKQDIDGNLITSQNGLNSLYLETFGQRIRARPINVNLVNLKGLKEELCAERIKLCKLIKSLELEKSFEKTEEK